MSTMTGKVAVVTGANSGIGLAAARAFAREGAQVVITGRRQAAVQAAVAEIGGAAVGIQGDVADLAHHARVADLVRDRFGGLDVYMANAGVNTITHSALVSPEEYDAQFAVNTRGAFFGVQALRPLMRDGGSIILTGSIASGKALEGHAVYAGSKAALAAFARSWALEFKSRGVRVNVLSPGPTDTAILGKMGVPDNLREDFMTGVAGLVPLGRLARPEELADAALFLASDASRFVTGVDLRVDGGMALL